MDARILRRQVAAPRLHLARARRPLGSDAVTTAPGDEAREPTSSQWPIGPVGRSSTSLPPIVFTATSIRPSLPTSAAATPRPFSAQPVARGRRGADRTVPAWCGASTRTGSASRPRLVTGIAPAASTSSGLPEFARSTHEAPQPAKPVPSAGSKSGRAFAKRRPGAEPVGGRRLAARVRHEQVGARRRRRGRDAHAGERVGDAFGRAALLEAEAEPGRVGLRAARPRHVHVELVRVLVVRDVEVGAAVAVVVRERGPRPCAELRRLEAGLQRRPRGTGAAAARSLVQEQQVADPGEVRREARERARRPGRSGRCSRR